MTVIDAGVRVQGAWQFRRVPGRLTVRLPRRPFFTSTRDTRIVHLDDAPPSGDAYDGKIDAVRKRTLSGAPGAFFVTLEHFDDRFVKRSESFQDFLLPNSMCWSTGGTVPVEEGVHTVLAMLPSNDRGRYSVIELQRAHRLWPHFNRATSLFIQTEALRQQAALGTDALQRMELGIVATDRHGRVFFANRQAESLLAEHPDIRLRGHVRHSRTATMDGTLRHALTKAASRGEGISFTAQGNSHPELLITAAPMRESAECSPLLGKPSVKMTIRVLRNRIFIRSARLPPRSDRHGRCSARLGGDRPPWLRSGLLHELP